MENKNTSSFKNLTIESYPISVTSRDDYDKYDLKWQKTRRFAEDTKHRKGLVSWVKYVVTLWLVSVLFVVTFNSTFSFKLSDSVLITLLATTTVNILGLAFIVLQGLFQINDKEE